MYSQSALLDAESAIDSVTLQLPDAFEDWFQETYHQAPSAKQRTHCKRELMQAVWTLLLDDDFVEAYEHGMVMTFADGITRLGVLRIFTYSADYPEK